MLQAFSRLKQDRPSVIASVLPMALAIPAARPHLLFSPFPEGWARLARSPTLLSPGSLEVELHWEAAIILQYSNKIAQFLLLKRRFENALFLNDYSVASAVLNQLHDTLGYSIWSMAAALLLAQLTQGLEGNKTLRKYLLTQTVGLPPLIAHCLSLRTEEDVSPGNYDSSITEIFNSADKGPALEKNFFVLQFLVNFHALKSFPDDSLAYLLSRGPDYALIDRYETLVRVLITLAARENCFPTYLQEIVSLVATSLIDPRLDNLYHLTVIDALFAQDLDRDALIANLDLYTSGEYERSFEQAFAGIATDPFRLEYYELYAKSLLHLSAAEPKSSRVSSTQADLLRQMIAVLRNDSGTSSGGQALLKFSYLFDMTCLAQQVFAFALRFSIRPPFLNANIMEALSASTLTPRFAHAMRNPAAACTFLSNLSGSHPHSECVALFNCLYRSASQDSDLDALSLPSHRRHKYRGLLFERQGRHKDAAASYEALRATASDSPLSRTDAELGLFNSYLSCGDLDRCVAVGVDAYIARGALPASADIRRLAIACEESPGCIPTRSLTYPLLFHIAQRENAPGLDAQRLPEACEEFLAARALRRPSELASQVLAAERDRLVFFLRYVCIPEVLDHSVTYESTQDLEQERIAICQQLRELDPLNETVYAREISRLTTAASIRKAMHTVGSSKVHADTAGIILSLDDSFREDFERYVKLKLLDPTILGSVSQKLKGTILIILTRETTALFTKLFNELKAKFISSNEYGLDSYLSVRIRHGTLTGQLRSVFERQHLLTRRDATLEVYHRNDYWLTRLQTFEFGTGDSVDACFQRFANRIDRTIDEVRNLWLQIRGEANGNRGLFDFEYTVEQLKEVEIATATVQDYLQFLDAVFKELWTRTEQSLRSVRLAFGEELQPRLMGALDELESDLSRFAMPYAMSELRNAIANCRTDLNNTLLDVAHWFELGDAAVVSDFQIGLAIDTSLEIIQRTFPTVTFFRSITVDSRETLRGQCLPHLLDVFYILLENVVKNARKDAIDLTIRATSDGTTLVVVIANSLGPGVNIPELERTALELASHAEEGARRAVIRSEGGSGYYKLGKIMTHDLKCRGWRIEVKVVDGPLFVVALAVNIKDLAA
jgi:hypothetical protein